MNHILKCHEIFKTDMVRGDNCYLYDSDDRRYVDYEAGVWCTVLGYNHPRIDRIIRNQLDLVMHLNFRYTSRLADEAALMLLNTAVLSDGKCVFLSSGSEAVEFGLQTARLITGRRKFITLADSYLAAYGLAGGREPNDWVSFDWSECSTCRRSGDCDEQCRLLQTIPFHELAGFAFEPGSSYGQVRFPPANLINNLIKQVKRHQGLLIVDEVTTGCGRTGKWWGFQHYDLKPDIVAAGKGIGNGFPVSAVMLDLESADILEKQHFRWSQSHQNDPLGCAVVKEVITVLREEALLKRCDELGATFLKELIRLKKQFAIVKEVRGRGLMIALEFYRGYDHFSLISVYQKLLERGILVGYSLPGNAIRFYPALTMGQSEIDYLTENLAKVLEELT